MKKHIIALFLIFGIAGSGYALQKNMRKTTDFNMQWKFQLNDTVIDGSLASTDDSNWRLLNLPHDWSIESDFGKDFPATPGGGALPGGLGWYRKSFTVDKTDKNRKVFVEFDGVYCNSEVWINGTKLGKRPNGYVSFRYDLTPYLNFGGKNLIAVRVDNSRQPNSRWYSGSGIYRNVRLVTTEPVYIDLWGTYVTTPLISKDSATITVEATVKNELKYRRDIKVEQTVYDATGTLVGKTDGNLLVSAGNQGRIIQNINIKNPVLWEIDRPYLYKVVTKLYVYGIPKDEYITYTGIRSFKFDVQKGFFLNGKHLKINGVCNHHDLGALGTAVNTRAIERQLQIMKEMGVNAIRTSHNPPAPELLDLCDRMGFIVMDEAFDMWRLKKTNFDYAQDFDAWHEKDLTDMVLRDRNHPSVMIWSIGNEVVEQWGEVPADDIDLQKANVALNNKKISTDEKAQALLGKNALLTRQLAEIVRKHDLTRPITAGCNGTDDNNPLFKAETLDLIGFNYHENEFADITARHPRTPFIVTESVSSLHTRGYYVNPSDQITICPESWDKPYTNPTQKCSAYDNCRAPWGATHESNLKIIKKYPHISGQFIWTGFDYLGEPTPYWWPSRSSYFGIVDLAGFPKDIYYMYQSEWTDKDVLHLLPHWNWNTGDTIDVWAYYNKADEVELYLNGTSLGVRSKKGDDLHVMWRVPYTPGTLKAVSRKQGKDFLSREIQTAGSPATIRLTADRNNISANGNDLSFVTVELLDSAGNLCPLADQLVKFTVKGTGLIAGTDNGDQNNHNSLKKSERNLFYGKCLAIVQNNGKSGKITLRADVEGLQSAEIEINCK
ncbi:MAG: Beta-galactosidase [Bacteroidetes bacterium]|nr:Beta-galactosidase [Bacteroidota bacterium]